MSINWGLVTFISGWTITAIISALIFWKKDGVEKAKIWAAIKEGEQAFKGRVMYSDLERETTEKRLSILEQDKNEHYREFVKKLEENTKAINEHIAFDKGKDYQKNK